MFRLKKYTSIELEWNEGAMHSTGWMYEIGSQYYVYLYTTPIKSHYDVFIFKMLSWVSSSFSCCICTIYWSVVTCNVEVNNMLKKQHRIKIADRGQLHLWAELDGVAALWVHKIVPKLRLILCLIAYSPDVIAAHKLMFWARSCFEPGFEYFL